MRPLELTLVVLLFVRLLLTLAPGRSGASWRLVFSILAALAMATQLGLEGPRWQLLPVNALVVWFALRALFATNWSRRGHGWRFGLGLLVFVPVVALPAVIPVPRMPAPSGPFAVGSFSFELSDANRLEIHGERAGRQRTVVVRSWYPAEAAASGPPAPWTENIDLLAPAMARYGGLPEWLLGHLRLATANATWGLPLASDVERYPVIFFEHGRPGWRSQSTFLMEDLASHGYVVLAVEHPYTAILTIFADGSEAPFLRAALPGSDTAEELAASQRTVEQWVEDVRLVAAALDFGAIPTFSGRLALGTVGVSGHSTGAASALQLCSDWDRCGAVVALDAWLEPMSDSAVERGSAVPTLFLSSDPAMTVFEAPNSARFDQIFASLRGEALALEIEGTGHHDFDDTGTFSPLARVIGYSKGPIRIDRAYQVIRSYTEVFFDRHLLGEEDSEGLLGGFSLAFPEVRFTGRRGE